MVAKKSGFGVVTV